MNGISIANDNLQTAADAQTALTDINNAICAGGGAARLHRRRHQPSAGSQQRHEQPDPEPVFGAGRHHVRPTSRQTVANLTKYQILSQTGISALAQANQMQQSVLKLLQ